MESRLLEGVVLERSGVLFQHFNKYECSIL